MNRYFMLAAVFVASAVSGSAATVRWNLDGVKLDDGGLVSGYFVVNADFNDYILPDYSIMTWTGSRFPAMTYNPQTAYAPAANYPQAFVSFYTPFGPSGVARLSFTVETYLNSSSGRYKLVTGFSSFEQATGLFPARYVTDGYLTTDAVGAPEPSAATMMVSSIVALALCACTRHRRRVCR